MVDPRFYESYGPVTLAALFPGCQIEGDFERAVGSVAALAAAGAGDLTFHDTSRPAPITSDAGAIVLRPECLDMAPATAAKIVCDWPRAEFARAAAKLHRVRGYTQTPAVAADARLEEDVALGPNVTIGAGAHVGRGARIGPGAVIGPGVRIGRRSQVGARAVIECALVGDDVTVLAGAVIGQTGFGIAPSASGPVEAPHFGRVIVEDRVTLGANSTVDRGLFDDTILSEDAKIDNLCHIAHNVVVGRGVIIAAFGGISGSSTIGDGAVLGGRVGVADHISVGRGAQLGGAAVVLTDVPDRQRWSGYPARALRRWLRETAWLARAAGNRNVGG